jgi:PTS system mannose-specific IIA component
MIGIVVVTHGRLAEELVNAARAIVGEIPRIAAVSIGWSDDVTAAHEAVSRAVSEVGPPPAVNDASPEAAGTGDGVLLLTDMFGGTPTNLSLPFLSPSVEIVTGVNLPMLIKLASLKSAQDLRAVAREMREHGRNAIWVASDLLSGGKSA